MAGIYHVDLARLDQPEEEMYYWVTLGCDKMMDEFPPSAMRTHRARYLHVHDDHQSDSGDESLHSSLRTAVSRETSTSAISKQDTKCCRVVWNRACQFLSNGVSEAEVTFTLKRGALVCKEDAAEELGSCMFRVSELLRAKKLTAVQSLKINGCVLCVRMQLRHLGESEALEP